METDNNFNCKKNILSLCVKNYKKFLYDDINKHCGYDVRSNRNISESDLFYMKQISENFIDLDPNSDNEIMCSYNNNFKGNNYVNKILNDYNTLNTTADISKMHILEEVYTLEYQQVHFLEQ